jgi:hypothetical protein
VDGFIVDVVRDDLLIEVQTRNFSAIREKLKALVRKHRVRLVYPLPFRKTIVHVDSLNGNPIKRRLSPKKGRLLDLFNEVVWIPQLCKEPTFELEVLMVEEEEIQCNDGRGSWLRRGASIKNHNLVSVVDNAMLTGIQDYAAFLPKTLDQPFTNKQLAAHLGISLRLAGRITYVLREMGALEVTGKVERVLLFQVST